MANNGLIWDDGRSGTAGCLAGNLVLLELAKSVGQITKIKGTVFQSPSSLFIGRVCASASYLSPPVLHWANASWDQHADLRQEANRQHKAFFYIFVTGASSPAMIHFWKVPAAIVEVDLKHRGKSHRGLTCAIHITESEGQHWLGQHNVTGFHNQVDLTQSDRDAFERAFSVSIASVPIELKATQNTASSATAYSIPVSGGRAVTLQVPGPLTAGDVIRVKSWIDVTADILTENSISLASAAQRQWLREQVQAGLDQLARGEKVDGEAAFERILSHRQRKEPS